MSHLHTIPILTTHDLWKKYVNPRYSLSEFFRKNAEDFLITRLEETKSLVRLPTQPHRRAVNEIVFVTHGQVVRGANLNKIKIRAGEIHLTMADQISTVDYLSEDVMGFYCHFSTDTIIQLYHKEHMISELATLNTQMQTSPLQLQSKALLNIKSIFERLVDEYHTKNELRLIDAYLVTLCYEMKSSVQEIAFKNKQPKAFDLTEQYKRLIVKHIRENQSVSFYADLLCISPNHLNKAVRQSTGKPASALISEMLILEAKVLLKHTALTISEVAFQLNFMDQSYFSRFFKKHTGSSPKSYKKQN